MSVLRSVGRLALQAGSARFLTTPARGRYLGTTLVRFNNHTFNVQDEKDFEDRVLNSKEPVIVDFHAEWCGPCKLLGPRLEKAVADKAGKVLLAKVNIDDLDDLSMEYKVRSVPTVIAVKNGQEVDRFIGLQEDDLLDAFVEKAMN